MGGHGGLNILPQKSWNVYNFDNREKVRKDEAKAAATDAARDDRQLQAEREFRLTLLRGRAAARDGGAAPAAAPDALAVAVPSPSAEHPNFFAAEEAALAAPHPETAAQERAELLRRGRADQHTSDARLDARHRLGVGDGDGAAPWYARVGSSLLDVRPRSGPPWLQQQAMPVSRPSGVHIATTQPIAAISAAPAADAPAKKRRRDRGDSSPHQRTRRSHSRTTPTTVDMAALRAERVARESTERDRQLAVTGAAEMPRGGREYHAGYGHAKPKR